MSESKLEIVLIGSRALATHLKDWRPKTEHESDWDLIGTLQASLAWMSQQGTQLINFEKNHCFDQKLDIKALGVEVEKDTSQWKHMDGKRAMELWKSFTRVDLSKVDKIHGTTKTMRSFEIELVHEGLSSCMILDYAKAHCAYDAKLGAYVADLPLLEAIKTSHATVPHKWGTHMVDLHAIRCALFQNVKTTTASEIQHESKTDTKDAKTDTKETKNEIKEMKIRASRYHPPRSKELQDLVLLRRLEAYCHFGSVPGSKINLNQSNDDFLENNTVAMLAIDVYVKHDDIHERVKLGRTPAYSDLRTDKSKVKNVPITSPFIVLFDPGHDEQGAV